MWLLGFSTNNTHNKHNLVNQIKQNSSNNELQNKQIFPREITLLKHDLYQNYSVLSYLPCLAGREWQTAVVLPGVAVLPAGALTGAAYK